MPKRRNSLPDVLSQSETEIEYIRVNGFWDDSLRIIPLHQLEFTERKSNVISAHYTPEDSHAPVKVLLTHHWFTQSHDEIIAVISNSRRTNSNRYVIPIFGIAFGADVNEKYTETWLVHYAFKNELKTIFDILFIDQMKLTNSGRLKIAHQVCEALHHSHTNSDVQPTSHQNFSSASVFVDSILDVRLCSATGLIDWHTSKEYDLLYHHSPPFINLVSQPNPEPQDVLAVSLFSDDIFSLSIFLFELFTGRFVHHSTLDQDVDEETAKFLKLQILKESCVLPEFKDNDMDSEELRPLKRAIEQCWTMNKPSPLDLMRIITKSLADIVFDYDPCKSYWLDTFPTSITVSVDEFIKTVYEQSRTDFNTHTKTYRAFHRAICDIVGKEENTSFVLKMREVFAVFEFLGFISDSLLESTCRLLRKQWFHGMLSQEEFTQKLDKASVGQYFFRFSSSDCGSFALSYKSESGIRHYRILHTIGTGYMINKIEFESLDEILFRYKKNLKLTTPCPGSKFQSIFEQTQSPMLSRYVNFDISDG